MTPQSPGSAAVPDVSPRIGVVIVAYNSGRHLPALVESLPAAASGISLEVVVVDNASTDDSVAVCAALDVACIATGENGGYSRAINIGIAHLSECDGILICNPDLKWAPGAIDVLWQTVQRTRGVAVPALVDSSGARARSQRRDPSVLGQLGEALLGDHWNTRPAILTEIVREPRSYHRAGPVDWATGAALLIHAKCVERVGPWDERYFLFSEEVDFMVRCRDAGFTIMFCPTATAWHEEGGSGRSPALVSLTAVNKLRYFGGKHGSVATGLYGLAVLLEMALRAADPAHRRAALDVARALWPAIRRRLPRAEAPGPRQALTTLPNVVPADG